VAVARAEVRYLQLPASDIGASADFYHRALGWTSRARDDGSTAFDDSSGLVSGEWVTDREASGDTGVVVYVWVDHVDAALEQIVAAGGEVVLPRGQHGVIVFATFRDPAGNVLGVFHGGD
jgi:hypothetical protein